MATHYAPIPQSVLMKPASITPSSNNYTVEISEESPAFKVMSDLKLITPATTTENTSLVDANKQMIERGVRMLFVMDEQQQLQGIITSNDLLGEKPLKHSQRHHCGTQEIHVKDVMVPIGQIEILDYSDIERAKVGDVITTLKRSGRHHALIADYQDDGTLEICGTFSLSHISHMMNTQVAVAEMPITTTQSTAEHLRHH